MYNTILVGDCLLKLKELPTSAVDCIATSPPYWGQRDYGVAGQLGNEPTFDEYHQKLTVIFRECRRVLKDTGTLWVNLGDKWLKKQLLGLPWKFAFSLQKDGWVLRDNLIWHKPNVMPESVTDRCTRSHEDIFMFAKAAKNYSYDNTTIEEKKTDERPYRKNKQSVWTVNRVIGECEDYHYDADAIKEPSVSVDDKRFGKGRIEYGGKATSKRQGKIGTGQGSFVSVAATRNKRSVWNVATKPFHGAHFAGYPEALIEPIIKAGCPKDGVVLDIFMGSGTTAVVAQRLGRRWIGIELNPDYAELANKRLAQASLEDSLVAANDNLSEGELEQGHANDNFDLDSIIKAINE